MAALIPEDCYKEAHSIGLGKEAREYRQVGGACKPYDKGFYRFFLKIGSFFSHFQRISDRPTM